MEASIVEVEKMVAEFSATTDDSQQVKENVVEKEIRNKSHWEKKVFAPFFTRMSRLKKKPAQKKPTTQPTTQPTTKPITKEAAQPTHTVPDEVEVIGPQQNDNVEVDSPRFTQVTEWDEDSWMVKKVEQNTSVAEKATNTSKITATEKGVLNAFRKCLRLPLNSLSAGKGDRVLYAAAEFDANDMNIDYYVHVLKELQNLE